MAPPTRTASTSNLLAELRTLAGSTPPGTPYDDLLSRLRDAGWVWYMRQTDVNWLPDSTVLITFDLQVGNAETPLTSIDQLSMHLGSQPGPVSIAARIGLDQALVYLVFGRLPPQSAALPQPNTPPVSDAPRTVQVDDTQDDILLDDLDDTGHDADDPFNGQEYVPEPRQPIDVIAKREPDGLPVLKDLYAIDASDPSSTRAIIQAVYDAFSAYLDMATTDAQVQALGLKNRAAIGFINDLGTKEDSLKIRELVNRRRSQIAQGINPIPQQPRRRTAG